ncbi:MarR family winged helix-turn-helix transcriptional regulator [Desulfogranum marinum]|uniref:MarR family winged helix-turn-helix transcriptional regulator n=1 Tax=Desulfogranum marinum TaxID=453220 RepID=UPI00374CF34C
MRYDPFNSYTFFLVVAAKRVRERLHHKFLQAGYDISPEKYGMLVLLSRQEGMSQQSIADKFEISKVAAFKLITNLEKRGFVIRKPDQKDGRSKLVYLTEQGQDIYEKLIVLAQDNLNECGQGIDHEELKILKTTLRKIIDNSQK